MTTTRVTTDLTEIDFGTVHRWLSEDAYWALGRSRETVDKAASASLNFGVLDADGTLLGYGRVVTDHATFAWLCDVYVDPASRGRGIGKQLARAVVDAMEPLGLTRLLLSTNDAHGLYAQVGFVPFPSPENYMQRTW